jgi:hypothetical protein
MGKEYGINEFLAKGSEGFGKVYCQGQTHIAQPNDTDYFGV